MSARIASTIEIAADPDRVFAHLADFRSHLRWESVRDGAGLVELEVLTGRPTETGTRFRSTGKDGSFVMRDESIVTVFEPARRLRYETVSKAAGAVILWRHKYEIEPTGAGTRVKYAIDGTPRNIVGWVLWPIVLTSRARGSKLVATTLGRLRQYCESHTESPVSVVSGPLAATI